MSNINTKTGKRVDPRRILVVEDDQQGAKLIEMVLRKLSFENIIHLENGKEGWEAISEAEEAFDLVISDWNMPEMTGIELLSRIREEEMDVPFIMITGRGKVESVTTAKTVGVTSFIPKPYTPQQLIQKIKAALEGTAFHTG